MAARKKSNTEQPLRKSGRKIKKTHAGPSLLTQPLGLEGWQDLEPVLLAAIASETPLLLVGTHGCAKSHFLERLAQSLRLEFRFYNASLINYDDLVGIPLPSADRRKLEYISTPSSIWDAEVVFIDEINRTKPELQNKIFPIIHERRVQGIQLEKLRFRWAAMNPPVLEGDESALAYLGAEPLDTALADRFGFVVEVPSWKSLTDNERRRVLEEQFAPAQAFPVDLGQLISNVSRRMEAEKRARHPELDDYLILLTEELLKIGVVFSTRRITTLRQNVLAVHAAREEMAEYAEKKTGLDWCDSAWQALRHSLPQIAEGLAPDEFALRTAHLQAWQLMKTSADTGDRVLLCIADPVKRALEAIRRAENLRPESVGTAIINCLSQEPDESKKPVYALAFYLATHRAVNLPFVALAAMEPHLKSVLREGLVNIQGTEATQRYFRELSSLAKTTEPRHDRAYNRHVMNLAKHVFDVSNSLATCKAATRLFDDLIQSLDIRLAA